MKAHIFQRFGIWWAVLGDRLYRYTTPTPQHFNLLLVKDRPGFDYEPLRVYGQARTDAIRAAKFQHSLASRIEMLDK